MSYSVTMSLSRVQSGESDYVFIPRVPRTGKPGVVLFHGAASNNMFGSNVNWPALTRLAAALANAGFYCIIPANNVDQYANDASMARITAAHTVLANLGASSSKIHLIGVSMGGGTVARWAGKNPAKVASLNALIPMANPFNVYQGKWGPGTAAGSETNQFVAGLAAAWGATSKAVTMTLTAGSTAVTVTSGTVASTDVGSTVSFTGSAIAVVGGYTDSTHFALDRNAAASGSFTGNIYTALPTGTSGADIIAAAAGATGTPGRLFYAASDEIIKPADVQSLASAAGWSAVSLTGGHANVTAANWETYNGGSNWSDLIANLVTNSP